MSGESSAAVPSIDGFIDLVEIGRGGFSTVFRATDPLLDRQVAIKVLVASDREGDGERFLRECRALASLAGTPGVVEILQATFTSDGRPCIVMPMLTGGSLAQRIRTSGPLDPLEVRLLGIRLARALEVVHGRGLSHRDIKPENVLFDTAGNAALSDFGLSLLDGHVAATTTATSLSPPFAPPERFGAAEPEDPVSGDVYSLAATLFAATRGAPPFGTTADGGILGLAQRVTHDAPAPLPASVPDGLAEAVASGLAKDPTDRPSGMGEFAALIESDVATVRRAAPAAAATPVGAAANDPVRSPSIEPSAENSHAPTSVRAGGAAGSPTWRSVPVLAAAVVALALGIGTVAVVAGAFSQEGVVGSDDVADAATTTALTPTTAPSSIAPSAEVPSETTSTSTETRSTPAEERAVVSWTTASSTLEPQRSKCTGERVDYSSDNAIDGNESTAWAPRSNGGIGERLTIHFEEFKQIRRIGVLPGYGKQAPISWADCQVRALFDHNRWVRTVRYHFAGGETLEHEFVAAPEVQWLEVPRRIDSDQVTVEILDTVLPAGANVDDDTLISEVVVEGITSADGDDFVPGT